MKAIDHGIDFIHGAGQSAEVLKQKDEAAFDGKCGGTTQVVDNFNYHLR